MKNKGTLQDVEPNKIVFSSFPFFKFGSFYKLAAIFVYNKTNKNVCKFFH